MYLRGDISILVSDLFRSVVAILTAPAVYVFRTMKAGIMMSS
jgi:hypothetical protein